MNLSPQLLEAINGFLLIEFIAILYLFARYIAQGVYTYGWQEGRRRRAAAIAVFVLILGDLIIRTFVWTWRHGINTGNQLPPELEALVTAGTTVGVLVAAVGGACIIRYFSPERWGEWPWAVVTVAGLSWAIWMAW